MRHIPAAPARRATLLARFRPATLLLTTAGSATLAACGGAPADQPAADTAAVAAACAAPTEAELLPTAVRAYLDERKPTPLRFLTAVGTDSAMPPAGMTVLQDRGPTFFFPADDAARAQVRGLLGETNWPTMLVTYHGLEALGDRVAEVALGGVYVEGSDDGTIAPRDTITFLCEQGRWIPADSATGAAPPAPPGA